MSCIVIDSNVLMVANEQLEHGDWLVSRAKLVRPGFVQHMVEHWSKGPIQRNRLARTPHSAHP